MSDIAATIVPHPWFDTRLEHTPSGAVEIVGRELLGQTFEVLNTGPLCTFNESVSFMLKCDTRREIDRYRTALTRDGGEEGASRRLKDRYGLSWQIVPRAMDTLPRSDDLELERRVTEAFLTMKKLDIAALERAAKG